MKVKYDYRSISRKEYSAFMAAHPETKLSYKEWSEILTTHNELLRDYALETGEIIKLPFSLGYLGIVRRKMKPKKGHTGEYINRHIDWAKTKAAGKYIYHLNSHTSGYSYKWKWRIKIGVFAYAATFHFWASRYGSRTLAKKLVENPQEYTHLYKDETFFKRL